MNHCLLKNSKLIRRIAVYSAMTIAVVAIVTFVAFFVLGYRFDAGNGRLEQYAFLQFGTSPSGATITLDGDVIGKTPNKSSAHAGKHEIVMWRDGYETWQKSIDVKAGTMTWLNYALLVPKKLEIESVASYTSLYSTLSSPRGRSMLIQGLADVPSYDLVDLGSDIIKSTKLVIPADIYSDANTVGVTHVFNVMKWDDGGRYVLVSHLYGDKSEWLVLDTQEVSLTKNITRSFNISISQIVFSGTSGNIFYVLDSSNDIRKLSISAGTISKPLVSKVTKFDVYESSIITYIGVDTTDATKRVAGLYVEGDENPHIMRYQAAEGSNLHIATTHYFNENYIAISDGKKVDILSGSYPNTSVDSLTSMKPFASYETQYDIKSLTFSPTGEYVLVQSDDNYASYDLEHQSLISSNIAGSGDVLPLGWLDDNYIWTDRGGSLVISEFDGTNKHTINPVLVGQDATLTHNGRYLYSFNKSAVDYQLQRVTMILP